MEKWNYEIFLLDFQNINIIITKSRSHVRNRIEVHEIRNLILNRITYTQVLTIANNNNNNNNKKVFIASCHQQFPYKCYYILMSFTFTTAWWTFMLGRTVKWTAAHRFHLEDSCSPATVFLCKITRKCIYNLYVRVNN